ncbi:MAG: hypothetical protein U0353_33795 [Sandaracinus sp.]
MRSACAIVVLFFLASGCALSHERDHPHAASDAAVAPDATTAVDVGTPSSCAEIWTAMRLCPVSTERALGQPCDADGNVCGAQCCEPGPAIVCTGGRWVATVELPDCSSVRCASPRSCGDGQCGRGAVCLEASGETLQPPRCAYPTPSIDTCGAAPPGALTTDPRACITCTCSEGSSGIDVTIDCACC